MRRFVINSIETINQKKKYIFAGILVIAAVIFFLGPTRTFYAWDKTVSLIRIPLQKVIRPSVHPWGHFAPTSPIVAHEVINGIEVPPLPGLAENKITLRGIDLNQDGVRDDIERYIAEQYGDDQIRYSAIREYVFITESALENQSSKSALKSWIALSCFPHNRDGTLPSQFDRLQNLYFMNTNIRAKAFIKVFTGTGSYGCDWYKTHKID
jgi:hypothetical protein